MRLSYPVLSSPVPSSHGRKALKKLLRLLLGRRRLGLGCLLPVALDHHHAQKGADDGCAQEDEDHGDADGPLARGEDVLEGVVGVDEGLLVIPILVCCCVRKDGTGIPGV